MSMQQDTFSKGAWIVHTYHGVGQIKGKEKIILEGEKKSFFKVKTFYGVYWLTVKNIDCNRIRPLASQYQISRALTLTRKAPKELPNDHKQSQKKSHKC